MILTILVILLITLICCSAFFSASEMALFSLSSIKIKMFKESAEPRRQRIASMLSHSRDLLVTIIILNVAVNILVQNVTSTIFGDYSTWLLNVGLPLALTLIFGEILPKSFSLANNERIAYFVAPTMDKAMRFFYPIRRIFIGVTDFISRIFFFFLRKENEVSIDEMQHALKTSRQYGILNEDEAELIRGYLKLQESTVKEFMRPREEVLYFDIEDPLKKLIHLFVDQECTRIPVCQGGLDNVIGIISSRLFFLHRPTLKTTADVLAVLKKSYFVPETISSRALLKEMYKRKESLALVVDEYGSMSGLISLEDLVETVVGEIADRRDEKSRFTQAGRDTIIASGKLELAEFEDIFNVSLTSENNMITIGGWLTEQIGDIPKSGTKFTHGDFLFHVLAADHNRVRRVYIRRLSGAVK